MKSTLPLLQHFCRIKIFFFVRQAETVQIDFQFELCVVEERAYFEDAFPIHVQDVQTTPELRLLLAKIRKPDVRLVFLQSPAERLKLHLLGEGLVLL